MSNKNWQNIHKIKLNLSRLQKQVPFSEEMNKLGYIITQLDLQHSAGRVGGTEKGAAEQNSNIRKFSKETVPRSILTSNWHLNHPFNFWMRYHKVEISRQTAAEIYLNLRCATLLPGKGHVGARM